MMLRGHKLDQHCHLMKCKSVLLVLDPLWRRRKKKKKTVVPFEVM